MLANKNILAKQAPSEGTRRGVRLILYPAARDSSICNDVSVHPARCQPERVGKNSQETQKESRETARGPGQANSKRMGLHTKNLGVAGQEESGETAKKTRNLEKQPGRPGRVWRNCQEARTGEFKTDMPAYLKSGGAGQEESGETALEPE